MVEIAYNLAERRMWTNHSEEFAEGTRPGS
jgi:hypothetical protein